MIGYLGTVKDITDRKRAERRLRGSLAENQALAAEQAALRRVATAVAGEAPPEEVFALVAREVGVLLGAAAGVVVRFGPQHGIVMGTWAAGGAREPGGGPRRAAERRERHRPRLSERRAGADGRLRRPGRGDGEADHRNAVSERRGGPDQGRPAHVGRDQRPHQPPRASSGRGRAAAGELRGARGGGGRERRGPCEARGPGRHRSPDRPRQPPRLLRAAPRRRRAGPPPRPPAQPGDHRPGLLQASSTTPTAIPPETGCSWRSPTGCAR